MGPHDVAFRPSRAGISIPCFLKIAVQFDAPECLDAACPKTVIAVSKSKMSLKSSNKSCFCVS